MWKFAQFIHVTWNLNIIDHWCVNASKYISSKHLDPQGFECYRICASGIHRTTRFMRINQSQWLARLVRWRRTVIYVPSLASPDMNYQIVSLFRDISILSNLVSEPHSYFIYYHDNPNFFLRSNLFINSKQISKVSAI